MYFIVSVIKFTYLSQTEKEIISGPIRVLMRKYYTVLLTKKECSLKYTMLVFTLIIYEITSSKHTALDRGGKKKGSNDSQFGFFNKRHCLSPLGAARAHCLAQGHFSMWTVQVGI